MKKILAGLILAGGSLFAAPHVSIGIGLGVPVVPAPVYVAPPVLEAGVVGVAPGPGYFWTPGYFYFSGGHRLWHAGFWASPVHRDHFVRRGFRR
jgi:hypothetical protein